VHIENYQGMVAGVDAQGWYGAPTVVTASPAL
jgi:hypothetical protein